MKYSSEVGENKEKERERNEKRKTRVFSFTKLDLKFGPVDPVSTLELGSRPIPTGIWN